MRSTEWTAARRSGTRWATGIIAVGALAVGLLATPADGATPNATTLYRQALASTRSWSVHYVSKGVDSKVTVVETGDAGPASGAQQVTVGDGTSAESASLIVIGDFTYIKGNASALANLMGFSASQAAADAGRWIQFSTADPDFAQVVAGIRSDDVAQELALQGPFTLGRSRKIDGYQVEAIRGTEHAQGVKSEHAVLYVQSTGRHLPVEEDTVTTLGKPNGVDHIVYSKWGEQVRPRAPTAPISLGSVSTV